MEIWTLRRFEHLLRKWTWWYRLRRALGWLVNGLIYGNALGLGLCLVVMIAGQNSEGLIVAEEYLLILLSSLAIVAAVAVLGGLFWPVQLYEVARLIDREFNLKERVITSLEYRFKPVHLLTNPELVQRQAKDTISSSEDVVPSTRFFWRITPLQLSLILLLGVSSIVVGILGAPLFERTQKERAFQQIVNEEITRIDELIQQIEQAEDIYAELTVEQRQELVQALDQAVKDLKQAQTTEQAVASLENTRDGLEELSVQQSQQQVQDLLHWGEEYEQTSSGEETPLDSFAQELAEGDFQTAAQELTNLTSSLSPNQAVNLAAQLEQAATELSENPALAEKFQQAAEALRQNDLDKAQQALDEASEMISQVSQTTAQQNAIQQIEAQVSESQQHIALGQSAQGEAGQSQNGSEANQGGGSGNEEQTTQGQGPEAGSSPINQGNAPGDGGENLYQQITPPENLDHNTGLNSSGPLVTLPGSSAPGDQILGQTNINPDENNSSTVPYIQVLPTYEEVVRRAVDQGQIPPALIPLVKKYFSQLDSLSTP